MFDFYSKYFLTFAIIFMITLIILPIVILSINAKLISIVENNNTDELQEYIKIQKAMIWTNLVVTIIYSVFIIIINIIFDRSKFWYISENFMKFNIKSTYWTIALILILFISLTIYMNYILNNINIQNGKDELQKIYIIVPIISIISLYSFIVLNTLIKDAIETILFPKEYIDYFNLSAFKPKRYISSKSPSYQDRLYQISY